VGGLPGAWHLIRGVDDAIAVEVAVLRMNEANGGAADKGVRAVRLELSAVIESRVVEVHRGRGVGMNDDGVADVQGFGRVGGFTGDRTGRRIDMVIVEFQFTEKQPYDSIDGFLKISCFSKADEKPFRPCENPIEEHHETPQSERVRSALGIDDLAGRSIMAFRFYCLGSFESRKGESYVGSSECTRGR
jgi:hypothetical protein